MEATAAVVGASQAAHVLLAISSTNNSSIKFASLPTKSAAAAAGGRGRTSPITTTSRSPLLSARNLARNPFPTRCYPERDVDSSRSSSTGEESPTHHPPPTPSTIDPKFQHPTTSEDALTLPPPSSSSSSHGLVLDVGPDHSWDNHEVGSPVIKRFVGDDKERWFMWYHGGGSSSSIGLALSNNGVHWERGLGPVVTGDDVGQAMHRSSDWWAFDTHCIRPSDVLIMSSAKLRAPGAVYWLYYTGFTQEKVEIPMDPKLDVFKSLPGLAISQDGRHWARIEGEHHSGALFDVGAAGNWDSLFVAAPKVVYHGRGDLRMYYHSWDPRFGQYAIGMARSRDGIRWVKLGKVLEGGPAGSFDEGGVMNGHVVRVNGKDDSKAGEYLMAYQGVSADGQQMSSIGLAVSSDGLKDWRRCRVQAVLKPSMEEEDGWDSRGVGAPCLVQMDGGDEWRLYYGGFDRGGRTGIGLAVSQSDGGGTAGTRPMSFERLTGFHL